MSGTAQQQRIINNKTCSADKVRNPASERCVLKEGRIGKKLLHDLPQGVMNKVMHHLKSQNIVHLGQTSKALRNVTGAELAWRKRVVASFEEQLKLLMNIHYKWLRDHYSLGSMWGKGYYFDIDRYDPRAPPGTSAYYDPNNEQRMLRDYKPLLDRGATTDIGTRTLRNYKDLENWTVWLEIDRGLRVGVDITVVYGESLHAYNSDSNQEDELMSVALPAIRRTPIHFRYPEYRQNNVFPREKRDWLESTILESFERIFFNGVDKIRHYAWDAFGDLLDHD